MSSICHHAIVITCQRPVDAVQIRSEAQRRDLCVNLWSLSGLGHDGINCAVVIRAKCARMGEPVECSQCGGDGTQEEYPGQSAEAEAWVETEPPSGDGWQLWETTSEGSPVSPVYETAEGLAAWCVTGANMGFGFKATYEQWLASFVNDTIDIDSTLVMVNRDALRPALDPMAIQEPD